MKTILSVATLLSIISSALAGDLVSITASDGKKSINLSYEQKEYVYGKAISHLETCNIGNSSAATQTLSDENISKLEKTAHIRITFNKNNVSLPVGAEIVNVHTIYILFYPTIDAIAQIATLHTDKIQHYSKCSGHSALYNLTCDRVISKIMSIPIHPSCAAVKMEHEKRL
jgi:hypothetical protein